MRMRMCGLTDDANIETIVFTPTLVKAAIKKFKIGGTSAPDDLPARLFWKTGRQSSRATFTNVYFIQACRQSAWRVETLTGNAGLQKRPGVLRCKL